MDSIQQNKLSEFTDSYIGPKSTSLGMAASILLLLSFGTGVYEPLASGVSSAKWYEIGFESFFVSLLYFALLSFLIKQANFKNTWIKIFSISFLFLTTELVRAIYVGFSANREELLYVINWPSRIVGSMTTGLIFFGIASIVRNDNFKFNQILNQLIDTQSKLEERNAITEFDIAHIQSEITSQIKLTIDNALLDAQTLLKGPESSGVVKELLRVSEDVVRPISHELFIDDFQLPETKIKIGKKKINTKRVLEIAADLPFHPFALGLMLFTLSVGEVTLTSNTPLASFLNVTLTSFFFAVALWIGLKFSLFDLKKSNLFFKYFRANIILLLATYLIINFGFFKNVLSLELSTSAYIYFFMVAIFINWFLAFYYAVQKARKELLIEVQKTNAELNWVNARLGGQLWTQRKHLGSIIHKDIQSKLISAALKYQIDIKNNVPKDKAEANALAVISGVTEDLYGENKSLDLDEVFELIKHTWDGLLEIKIEIEPDLKNTIAHDQVCLHTLSEFLTEFSTNAVKHGKATKSQAVISKINPKELEISLSNNGIPLDANYKPGLGTHISSQQCVSLNMRNLDEGGIEVRAVIPVN